MRPGYAILARGVRPERQDHPGEARIPRRASTSFGLRADRSCWRRARSCTVAERPLVYPLYGSTLALGRVSRSQPRPAGRGVGQAPARRRSGRTSPASRSTLANGDHRTAVPGRSFVMLAPPERLVAGEFRRSAGGARSGAAGRGVCAGMLEDRDGATLTADAPAGKPASAAGRQGRRGRQRESAPSSAATLACYTACDRPRVTLRHAADALLRPRDRHRQRQRRAGDPRRDRQRDRRQRRREPRAPELRAQAVAAHLRVDAHKPERLRRRRLQVRVNDLLWDEVPTLYGRGPIERIYTLAAGRRRHAARSSSATASRARACRAARTTCALTYRKGSARRAICAPNQLTMLLSRPLGREGRDQSRRRRPAGRTPRRSPMRARTRRCAC